MEKQSNTKIVWIIIAVVVLCLAAGGFSSYNTLVSKEESVAEKWGNVQTQYQRRADLIPNLVSTVKGYAKHEEETLSSVVEARAKATALTVNADDLTPERLREIQAAQGELSTAIGRLLAVQEQYPQLQASENFSELQAQLEGTENRIGETRRLYNEAVRDYNTRVRRFPTNIIAGLCGFDKKPQFEAEAGSEKAPTVEF
jgi:LemA protein